VLVLVLELEDELELDEELLVDELLEDELDDDEEELLEELLTEVLEDELLDETEVEELLLDELELLLELELLDEDDDPASAFNSAAIPPQVSEVVHVAEAVVSKASSRYWVSKSRTLADPAKSSSSVQLTLGVDASLAA
jgi:hypothetical protein